MKTRNSCSTNNSPV